MIGSSNASLRPVPPARRSSRGAWTIAAIFALGLAILGGLFIAPRAKSPAVPAGLGWGVPEERLWVALCDFRGQETRDTTFFGLVEANPGLVLAVNLGPDEALQLAGDLGMAESYDPHLYQRALRPGGNGSAGACILARKPLYDAAPLLAPGHDARDVIGVTAVAVIDGRKVFVALAYAADENGPTGTAALLDAWKRAGSPPAVLGGFFGGDTPRAMSELSAAGLTEAVADDAACLMIAGDWRADPRGLIRGGGIAATGGARYIAAMLAPLTHPGSAPSVVPEDRLAVPTSGPAAQGGR